MMTKDLRPIETRVRYMYMYSTMILAKGVCTHRAAALRLGSLVRQQVIEHHRLALPNRDQRRVGRRLRRPFRAVHALLLPTRFVQ